MEVMFLEPEYLSALGSLVAAGLLFAMTVGAVVYGWLTEQPTRVAEERKPFELKKAA